MSSLARSHAASAAAMSRVAILGFPGETFAHDVQRRELGKFRQQFRFAGLPGRRLDELHDGDRPAVADVAEDHAERRRRLALAGAGVDDDQALVAALRRHHLVARRLVLAHLLVVAGVGFVIARGVRHAAVSFSIALSAVSVASIPAALFERGCQSPRRIASWKRLAVSPERGGIRFRHEGTHALVFEVGREQLIEMMVADRARAGRKSEQVVDRRCDLERALVAVAHDAGDPFRIGGAPAHDAGDLVRERCGRPALPGATCRQARRAAPFRAGVSTVAARPPMN